MALTSEKKKPIAILADVTPRSQQGKRRIGIDASDREPRRFDDLFPRPAQRLRIS
jgi:hypothetical protein